MHYVVEYVTLKYMSALHSPLPAHFHFFSTVLSKSQPSSRIVGLREEIVFHKLQCIEHPFPFQPGNDNSTHVNCDSHDRCLYLKPFPVRSLKHTNKT